MTRHFLLHLTNKTKRLPFKRKSFLHENTILLRHFTLIAKQDYGKMKLTNTKETFLCGTKKALEDTFWICT